MCKICPCLFQTQNFCILIDFVLFLRKKILSVHLPIFQISSKDPFYTCNFTMYDDVYNLHNYKDIQFINYK
jgi:hypothetical protein